MNRKALLIALVIPSLFIPTQEKITVVQFDQHYEIFLDGNMKATWDLTIIPGEGVKSMLLHAFFSQKAYIKDLVVTDSEGSLNSKTLLKEGTPIIEITFRERLTPGAEYHFTCNLDVWKAVDIGETEGSFTLLTGYNFPIENLHITAVIPEGTKVRNYFPADGRVSSGNTLSWVMKSLPSGFNIQTSISFDILSESFADNVFQDGVNLYDLQDFENARRKFEEALDLYESLDIREKINACTTYLSRIDGLEQGLPLFTDAVALYDKGDFDGALTAFNQVKSIYEDHDLPTDEIDEYISNIHTYEEAFSELQKGKTALDEGKNEEARTYFSKARDLFSEVGDSDMVAEVDAELSQIIIEVKPTEPPVVEKKRPFAGVIILVVVVVVGAVLLVLVKSKLQKPAVVLTAEEIREEMRQLKARFVYGEINKKEYEDRLAELEEKLKKPKPK